MQKHTDLFKLCSLIVNVLEVETRKAERDIIDEVCESFEIDLSSLEKKFRIRKRIAPDFIIREKFRNEVAQTLSNQVRTPEILLNAVLKSSAGFLDMIDAIYAFLSKYSATIGGSSEEFKFKLGDVDLNISISPAFIETIHRYERAIINLQIGTINYDQLSKFLGIDGDYYGGWPLRSERYSNSPVHERNVARDITYLPWLKSQIDIKRNFSGWDKIKRTFDTLSRSVEMFIKESIHLIDAHIRGIYSKKELDQDEIGQEKIDPGDIVKKITNFENWREECEKQERELYQKTGCLRAGINPEYFGFKREKYQRWLSVDIEELFKGPHFLFSSPTCVSVLNDDPYSNFSGTYIGGLACLCGIWKSGLQRKPSNDEILGKLLINESVEEIQNWLDDLNKIIIEITNWLSNTIWQPKYTVNESVIYESLEQYLNLPLWRERWQLYEIWLMCATLETVGSNGWSINIDLKRRVADNSLTWILPKGIAEKPCGILTNAYMGDGSLEIWYQSSHLRNNTKIMPDIAIRTPMPFAQDLVIVEAKDRYRMPTKSIHHGALTVGKDYMMHSLASVIWVVNYCKFSGTLLSDPEHNHGDAWHNLFFASEMKPKNVPLNFQETIVSALLPLALRTINEKMQKKTALVFVIDTTGSMHERLTDVWSWIQDLSLDVRIKGKFASYWSILFGDHDPKHAEPYVFKKLGPFTDLNTMAEFSKKEPLTDGGDDAEALEDAINACRSIPLGYNESNFFIVITDAPPHECKDCPNNLIFQNELQELLNAGNHCIIAEDWMNQSAKLYWIPFTDNPGLHWININSNDSIEILSDIVNLPNNSLCRKKPNE